MPGRESCARGKSRPQELRARGNHYCGSCARAGITTAGVARAGEIAARAYSSRKSLSHLSRAQSRKLTCSWRARPLRLFFSIDLCLPCFDSSLPCFDLSLPYFDSSLPPSSPLICALDSRLLALLRQFQPLAARGTGRQVRVSISSSPSSFTHLGCALPLLLIWMCTASARLGCALQFTYPLQLCFPPLPLFLSMSFLCLWLCYTDADWKCSSSLFLQLIAQWQVHLPSSAIMIPGLI